MTTKIDASDERFVFMPETEVLAARGTVQTIRDHWWSVHPEKGLRFWQPTKGRQGKLTGASPQCNSNKLITERLMYQGDEMKLIPLVLAPINVSDYA